MNQVRTPWLGSMGEVPASLNYQECTMFEAVEKMAEKYPDYHALDFMGKKTVYAEFVEKIRLCAKALKAIGVNAGDTVAICMPNAPQTVIAFYAVNLIGGISNMIHPLSSEQEIIFYLRQGKSRVMLTLDQVYPKLTNVLKEVRLDTLLIASIKDELPPLTRIGYQLTQGRKIKKVPAEAPVLFWKDFIRKGKSYTGEYVHEGRSGDVAAILYSGGTTGTTKGILLSNRNFNALGEQIMATNPMAKPGDKMLAVMPMFHGFGLGVCIHSMLAGGCCCLLIPRFNAESYASLLKKLQPNFIAGVPTLYEALARLETMEGVNLACLKGVFSGGDSLSIELKKRFDAFLKEHGAAVEIREGYGTTECVTASCLTPVGKAKEGSIGIPFPDTYYKIVKVGTTDEVDYGEEGEICISGPTVMLGYLDQPEETANTLKVHSDGLTWLHTGDLGIMDDEGFIYFRQRIKRMIITSGYNVYPSQIENILDAHESVHMSCVIGVKDSYKMQKVKAFVTLKPGYKPNEETKKSILSHCKRNVAKYAMPYDIEFRDSLPTTLVGKVAYRVLEDEEAAKQQ